MKFHKITLLVANDQNAPDDEVKYLIMDNKYLSINVKEIVTIEVENYSDDHPLNVIGCGWKIYFE